MKILVVTKRFYTNQDLLVDRYGRLWQLPELLAGSGHKVLGCALSYRPAGDCLIKEEDGAEVDWRSANMVFPPGIGLVSCWRKLKSYIANFEPDLIWASSDVFQVMLGAWLGAKQRIPVVADLYDNYESFGAAQLFPGATRLFRSALAGVQGITCASATLADKVSREIPAVSRIKVIANGVDRQCFRPMDKAECRRRLGLPIHGSLVGVAGALYANRGISVVSDACRQLQGRGVSLRLAVAGPRDKGFQPPAKAEGFDLGVIAHEDVPTFVNALDVAVISNIDSEFGRYCFPVKLYETVACGVPLAAAAVGAVAEIFSDEPRCLFQPGDAEGLAAVIEKQLHAPVCSNLAVPSWRELAHDLESFFEEVLAASPRSRLE